MPGKARIYIAFMLCAGVSISTYALFHWECHDPIRFFTYFLLALVASGLKVSLPGIFGTMSVNFLFILVGILEMSFPETLLMGCAATLVQCIYHAKFRPKFLQTSFSVSSMAVAVAASALVHGQTILDKPGTHLVTVAFVACTYFVANTVSIAAVIGLTESKSVWKVWQECYFWCFPYYLLGASIAWLLSFSSRYVGSQSSLLAIPIIYFIYRSYRSYLGRIDDQTKHIETMAALHVRTIEALALAIEAKDDTTHDHLRRVSVYAVEIGKAAGLSEVELNALHAAALLHDIGKLAVPENIISKPGKLKPEEFEKMKIHPVVGAEILDRVQFPYPVVPIVRSHHEKWDGTGYPAGLKGEEIPLGARILSAVDCLDALASDRQYRRALPLDEAMAKVALESGKSFDPRIVELLQARYVELERVARTQPTEPSKLSKNLNIRNGAAPSAGFEGHHISPAVGSSPAAAFLSSIINTRRESQVMFEFTEALGMSLSLDDTLPVVARIVRRMIPYDSLAVYLLRHQTLRPAFVDGLSSQLFSSLEIPLGAGLSGWVARNNEPIINGNPTVEPGYAAPPGGIVLSSALAVPLIGSSGVIGVIALYHAEKDVFSRDHLRILCEISSKAASSVENGLKYQEVESSATTDYVTGLPNARSLFLHLEQELELCRRFNSHLAVLVCDLDGFKQVNDHLGHLEGNKLLSTVGNALRDCCRESAYVARLGGDEFVVILPDTRPEAIGAKVRLFNQSVKEAGRLLCGEDILSISVGEAFYPGGGITPDQLLSEADRQMFNAKRRNKKPSLHGGLDQPMVRPDVIMLPGPPSSLTH